MIRNLLLSAWLATAASAALAQAPAEPPVSSTSGAVSEAPGAAPAETPARASRPSGPAADPAPDRDDATAAGEGSQDTTKGSEPAATAPPGVKTLSGMSVLGNQEAPTSLVIVPWKSSEMGAGIGVSRALDTTIGPVDKDVFARELEYYEIRETSAERTAN